MNAVYRILSQCRSELHSSLQTNLFSASQETHAELFNMDNYSLRLMEDIVLETRGSSKANSYKENVKHKNVRSYAKNKCKISDRPDHLKVELQTLQLSLESEKEIYAVLKEIRGSNFQLTNASEFEGNSPYIGKQLFFERTNFVKEVTNYSINDESLKSYEHISNDFTTLKLETYNFHSSHCTEALEKTKGHMGKALELLFYKYYGIEDLEKRNNSNAMDINAILEIRQKEKKDLQSNYGDCFKEKIKNRVWIFNVNLNYLIENCQHLGAENKSGVNNNSLFSLEIRFPENSEYPYEPPYFYFYKTDGTYSALNCLRIARRLHNEALKLCDNGNPYISSIMNLLNNKQEIQSHLENSKDIFLAPNNPLLSESPNSKMNFSTDKRIVSMINLKKEHEKNREKLLREVFEQNMEIKVKSAEILMSFVQLIRDRDRIKVNDPLLSIVFEIITTIKENKISIIASESGCGKSTQIPQFILNDWLVNFGEDNKESIQIISAQPRRLNAIAAAAKVAEQRNDKIGNSVGYETRFESNFSVSTRLKFCTVEIVLQKLYNDPFLKSVTHIIVDEAQERTAECDFLLMVLRKITSHRKDLKIIIMSTTSSAELFANYFGKVPIIEIPYKIYPVVSQLFIEDFFESEKSELAGNSVCAKKIKDDGLKNISFKEIILEQAEYTVLDEDLTVPQIIERYRDYSEQTQKNLYLMDHNKFDPDLVVKAIEWIVLGNKISFCGNGTLLVLLPGVDEVMTINDMLARKVVLRRPERVFVTVLHQNIKYKDLDLSYEHRNGCGIWKIVLTTSISETSMNLHDCDVIIDSGKIRDTTLNPSLEIESSKLSWISKTNANHRLYLANRSLCSGICIHLYSSFRYKYHLLDQSVPEIMKIPLESFILRTKILEKRVFNFNQGLGVMLNQPPQDRILSAFKGLQHVGALDPEFLLTPLGHHLAALNIDVRVGKLILYGTIFNCIDSALTIAACLIHRSPFNDFVGKKQEISAKKKEYATADSDHITFLRMYKQWREINAYDYKDGVKFANDNFLSIYMLHTLAETKHKLLDLLVLNGFVSVSARQHPINPDQIPEITVSEVNINNENYNLVQGLLCAALYPSVVKMLPQTDSCEITSGQIKPEEFRLLTKDNETVYIHPSSVNYKVKNFSSSFFAFEEKIEKSKTYIKEVTMTPVLPLVLLSGYGIDIEFRDGQCLLSLGDNWLMFAVESFKVAQLLQLARVELRNILKKKMQDPHLNLLNYARGRKIINTIVNVITNC